MAHGKWTVASRLKNKQRLAREKANKLRRVKMANEKAKGALTDAEKKLASGNSMDLASGSTPRIDPKPVPASVFTLPDWIDPNPPVKDEGELIEPEGLSEISEVDEMDPEPEFTEEDGIFEKIEKTEIGETVELTPEDEEDLGKFLGVNMQLFVNNAVLKKHGSCLIEDKEADRWGQCAEKVWRKHFKGVMTPEKKLVVLSF
jgi:hypothetical protein